MKKLILVFLVVIFVLAGAIFSNNFETAACKLTQNNTGSLQDGQIRVPIILYHHVLKPPFLTYPFVSSLNVSTDQFDKQLSFYKQQGYTTISLDQLKDGLEGKAVLPKKPLLLTFDDGGEDLYQNAYPILKKYNFQSSSFLITGRIGNPGYLSWDQVKELKNSGIVMVGSHSVNHYRMTLITDPKVIRYELTESKKTLEEQLGQNIGWFSYPYGNYNNHIASEVKKANYKGAVSTVEGAAQSKDKLFFLPRLFIDGRCNLNWLKQKLN